MPIIIMSSWMCQLMIVLSSYMCIICGTTSMRPLYSESDDVDNEVTSEPTLVQILFRHGDRSPISVYPTDIHEQDWKVPLGELTKLGAQQSFNLGIFLRDHYLRLHLKNATNLQVHVRSTSYPRAVMTAQCVMAGMVSENRSSFDPRTDSQPINVHHPPLDQDQLLSMVPCPITQKLGEVFRATSQTWKQLKLKHQPLFSYLSNYTGIPVNSSNVVMVADVLFCELAHNMSQPDWMDVRWQEDLLKVFNVFSVFSFPSPRLQQLQAGPLLDKMLSNIDEKLHKDHITTKLYAYSAHDSNLIAFLSALGVHNGIHPPYCACVLVELHQTHHGDYVKFLYKNESHHLPYTLPVKGCVDGLCELAYLHKFLNNVILKADSRPDACHILNDTDSVTNDSPVFKFNSVMLKVAAIITACVAVTAAVSFLVYRRNSKSNTQSQNYRHLETSETSLLADDNEEEEEEFLG